MKTVISVDAMRRSDEYTVKNFMPSRQLMFNAGKAVFDSVAWTGRVAVVCGSGNNAGDGYVLAQLLKDSGITCHLFLLSDRFSEDGRYYYEQCIAVGIRAQECDDNTNFEGYDFIVDCIFGTGFKGTVKGKAAAIIDKINSSSAKKICVDINSGLDGDSGMTEKCVVSDLTLSIGYLKSGHFLNMAKDNIQCLKNCDIGIRLGDKGYCLVEKEDIAPLLIGRKNFSHKGEYGYVALIGGSARYPGAVKLANLSYTALRSGCGVAKLVVPASMATAVAPLLLESTLFPVSDNGGDMIFVKEEFDEALTNVRAVAVGVGWGRSVANTEILRYLITKFDGELIVDADALNTLAEMGKEIFNKANGKLLLTPHIKEFERLTGLSKAEILSNPIQHAKNYAEQTGVNLLLKGPCTIITDGERVFLCDKGCAGMATAGSGDVLTGALLGASNFGRDSLMNAAAAAYIAGLAGEIAQSHKTDIGMTAGDTTSYIPDAIKVIRA